MTNLLQIAQRKQIEKCEWGVLNMLDAADFYKKMLDNTYEGVYFVDSTRQITFWNKGAERITGFNASEVIGHFCHDNILNHVDERGNKLCLGGCPLHTTINDGLIRETLVYLHHKNGHRVPVSVRAVPIQDGDVIVGAVELFTDESVKHEAIRDMEAFKVLAMKDQLTGVSNRRHLNAFLDSKLYEFKMLGMPFGVLMIDIDEFKIFNDTYGHDTGDEVLKMVSNTCLGMTRSTDLFGRWGGEEFVAVLAGIDVQMLQKKAEQMRVLIESSALRDTDQTMSVTISIGATMIGSVDTIQSMLKRVDGLLYKSKHEGRNRVSFG